MKLSGIIMPDNNRPPPERCRWCGSEVHGADCFNRMLREGRTTHEERKIIEKLQAREMVCMRINRLMRDDSESSALANQLGISL